MSWSIEEHIGECRPFPAQVVVYRGETDECLAYVSGEVADRLKAENAKLHAELTDLRLTSCPSCGIKVENERLREEVHYLKKGDILHVLTDQEYIDQCERERLMQVSIDALDKDNAKLRELVRDMSEWAYIDSYCDLEDRFADRMRELGVEA